jgi:hypothetical protein
MTRMEVGTSTPKGRRMRPSRCKYHQLACLMSGLFLAIHSYACFVLLDGITCFAPKSMVSGRVRYRHLQYFQLVYVGNLEFAIHITMILH